MNATPVTTIPNRPAGRPVFDFDIGDRLCRVTMQTVSNDGQNIVLAAWAFLINGDGAPVIDSATGAPTATPDGTNTVHLSNVIAGTKTLYDGWCKTIPEAGTVISPDNLPAGWTSGSGAPAGAPAIGTGYYDTTGAQPWTYSQGELNRVASGYAEQLALQIDTAAKLSALGL